MICYPLNIQTVGSGVELLLIGVLPVKNELPSMMQRKVRKAEPHAPVVESNCELELSTELNGRDLQHE